MIGGRVWGAKLDLSSRSLLKTDSEDQWLGLKRIGLEQVGLVHQEMRSDEGGK
jgi:hypothetical protein